MIRFALALSLTFSPALAPLAVATAASAQGSPAPVAVPAVEAPPLREALESVGRTGVAIDARETRGEAARIVTRHFSSVTPENHMKPDFIQPSEGVFTWDKADELVAFAKENDLAVYGHTLIWHNQTPNWFFLSQDGGILTNSPEHQALLLERMKAHIEAIAARYGDDVWAFDVVNEAIDENEPDGLRQSRWKDVLGPDYIAHAFRFARAAFPPDVKLFINDYGTEIALKREPYLALVRRLLAEGVPIDGVGHQVHIRLDLPPDALAETLSRFAALGVRQAVTELDIALGRDEDERLDGPQPERIAAQGHLMAGLADVMRRHAADLDAVTFWGLNDSRTWLRYYPVKRPFEAPLPFDDGNLTKPMFWGIVDPERLPQVAQVAEVTQADIRIDDKREEEWDGQPDMVLSRSGATASARMQLRWSGERIFAIVHVSDATEDAGDGIDFFVGDEKTSFSRDEARPVEGGYLIENDFEADTSGEVPFDVRIRDASGEALSWSDRRNTQDETSAWRGRLTLVPARAGVAIPQAARAPEIDAERDDVWADAPEVSTDVTVEGNAKGAKARVSLLWRNGTLYVFARVQDPRIDVSASDAYQQDSIEVFLAPCNERRGIFQGADGQYRINAENMVTVSGDRSVVGDAVRSATKRMDDGYSVEAAIAVPGLEAGRTVGLELQVNDGTSGRRTAVHTWVDPTGLSYRDTSRWGSGRLLGSQ